MNYGVGRAVHFMSRQLILCIFVLVVSDAFQCQEKTPQVTEQVEVTADAVRVIVSKYEIKAGDLFEFTIMLDRAPNFVGGSVQYAVAGPERVRAVNNCSPTSASP